jgi:hypothetical protein
MDRNVLKNREDSTITDPIGKDVYHNELISPWNVDRPQVVIETLGRFSMRGYALVGSGTLIDGTRLQRLDKAWLVMWERLREKAEIPPFNYTAPTATLTDYKAVYEREEIIFPHAWNLSMLQQMMNAVTYNEGMSTLTDDFRGKYRRISDLMEHYRSLLTIDLTNMLLDKFCHLVTPYEGGPLYAMLFDTYSQPWTGSNPATNWTTAIDLDRGVTDSDVVKILLDDIEEAWEEVSGQAGDSSAESQRTDYRQIRNLMAALGFPSLKLPERRALNDPGLWAELQFCELFQFYHNEDLDKHDIAFPVFDDVDKVIHRAFPVGYKYDWRDFIGFLPYAVKDGETEDHQSDNVVFGMVHRGPAHNAMYRTHRIYTAEDEWFTTEGALDLADADGLQAYIWSMPWVSKHIYSSKAIAHEEAEEDYWLYGPGQYEEFDMRADNIGRNLFRVIHDKQFGGYDVPIIR